MYRIKGRLELALLFNQKEFPFDRVNSLDFIHISSSSRLGVPMIHLKVCDAGQWLVKNQLLLDGVIINVLLKVRDKTQSYAFRLNSYRENQSESGPTYDIDGYFDCPLYWLKAVSVAPTGTSNKVLTDLAESCKLKFEGVNTSDQQTWQTKNRKAWQFARDVAAHGYVDDGSCMQLALDLDGVLRYKNVSVHTKPVATFVSAEYKPETFLVSDFRPRNVSGVANAISGYADEFRTAMINDIDGDPLSKVVAKKLSSKMMVNADLLKQVQRGRVTFGPIDCGNTHSSYSKAEYQNRRLAGVHSFAMDIVTPDFTEVPLLSFVQFNASEPSTKSAKAYSGMYLVISKCIYIAGINYYEKLELVRHGVNAQVKGQV